MHEVRLSLSRTDAKLLAWAGRSIGVPKENPADSFVLHAPLELMARAALLPLLPSPQRDATRERLVWLVATYEDEGPPVSPPRSVAPASVEEAATVLLKAIDASDLDEVDRYASWLGDHAPPDVAWTREKRDETPHGGSTPRGRPRVSALLWKRSCWHLDSGCREATSSSPWCDMGRKPPVACWPMRPAPLKRLPGR